MSLNFIGDIFLAGWRGLCVDCDVELEPNLSLNHCKRLVYFAIFGNPVAVGWFLYSSV
jgi:hypothetical protein